MKRRIIQSAVSGVALTLMMQQSAVAAITDYVVTGSFYADYLEVRTYDEQTGDEIFVDAYISGQPINIPTSPSFTLSFSVDESVDGTVPLFSSVAFFNNALSNVTLDINGSNVLTSTETDRVSQFPGSNGFYSRWGWSHFSEDLLLPGVEVFDYQTGQSIANLNADFLFFALYDSTDTVYGGGFPLDLITASLSDFTGNDFSLYWSMSYDDGGGEPFDDEFNGEATYRVLGNIESITAVSEVPLPAAAWLFGSALFGLGWAKRKKV